MKSQLFWYIPSVWWYIFLIIQNQDSQLYSWGKKPNILVTSYHFRSSYLRCVPKWNLINELFNPCKIKIALYYNAHYMNYPLVHNFSILYFGVWGNCRLLDIWNISLFSTKNKSYFYTATYSIRKTFKHWETITKGSM